MIFIERGAELLAMEWTSDPYIVTETKVHRFAHREPTGLCVCLCGLRQEDRGNGWELLANGLPDIAELARRCEQCDEIHREEQEGQ